MKRLDYLQEYRLTLSVRSPLFVGAGRSLHKNEYLYNPRSGVVSFLDEGAFLQMLVQRQLADEYERYILSGSCNLWGFLNDVCGLSREEIMHLTPHYLKAGNAIGSALGNSRSQAQIFRFQMDAAGQSYIPGSSVKGALRTVWLTARILEQKDGPRRFTSPTPGGRDGGNPVPEGAFANLLHCDERNRNNAVNSIFRGVSVSDSATILPRQFTLCRKVDVSVDGKSHAINLIRECAKPTTQISFRLTLDQSILGGRVTAEGLLADVARWSRFYREHCLSRFAPPRNAVDPLDEGCILLGGGAGFLSKSLKYPYWGDARALEDVSALLNRAHAHVRRDRPLGISPRTMKYTEYENRLYPFGVCGVQIQ